jgi:hopene-associated glycosyltransferase HpnB
MALAPALLACISTSIWIYLLVARGGFWLAAQCDGAVPRPTSPPAAPERDWPHIAAVVPARDEEAVIGRSVDSLLRQDYAGQLSIIVVDDHSSDNTAAVAAAAAAGAATAGAYESAPLSRAATVLSAPELKEGWSGKLSAVAAGLAYLSAQPHPPEYVLLTDADICHAPQMLAGLVCLATDKRTVLTSLMAKLRCESMAERALIPAFIFFFQMLYPFAWVNRADRATAAAAGGCMLIHRPTLIAAGGIGQIRGALIDDCALARLLKPHGPIWIGLTERATSVRAYGSIGDVAQMVVRSAYAELRFSPWRLAGAIAGMLITYLAPPALAIFGSGVPQLVGACTWGAMAIAFQPTLRFYGRARAWGLALPAIAMVYVICTMMSAYQHLRGRSGFWKGRVHLRASEG